MTLQASWQVADILSLLLLFCKELLNLLQSIIHYLHLSHILINDLMKQLLIN